MSIRKIAERLNPVIVKHIQFIHAWSGCNKTSAIFNKGKTELMKLIAKGVHEVLDKTDATPEEIGKAGFKLFVTTYGMYFDSL